MSENLTRTLFHEYFYKRLTELEEEQRKVVYALRTKTGLLILCDKLRWLEAEKLALMRVYEDLKVFL